MTAFGWVIISSVNMFLLVLCMWWAVRQGHISEISLLTVIGCLVAAWFPFLNAFTFVLCIIYILADIAPNVKIRFK